MLNPVKINRIIVFAKIYKIETLIRKHNESGVTSKCNDFFKIKESTEEVKRNRKVSHPCIPC